MHVLEKSGERQLFYAKHAKMCLILIIGVNYVSAFITSAALFLTCCVEPPETSQGRGSSAGGVAGGGGRQPPHGTLAFKPCRNRIRMACSVLSWPREVLGEVRHLTVSPPRRGQGCALTGSGLGACPAQAARNCFLSPPTVISALLDFYQNR